MTVCVAALAEHGQAIVVATDKMATYRLGAEDAMEGESVGVSKRIELPTDEGNWCALVAGSMGQAELVVHTAVQQVQDSVTIPGGHATSVMDSLQAAYKRVRWQEAEARFLTARLMVPADLHQHLNERYVRKLAEAIAGWQLDVQLLVCGFSADRNAHLFSVTSLAAPTRLTRDGYAAIGSGLDFAMGTLLGADMDRADALPRVLYHVIDAKIRAETKSGVGGDWDAWIMGADATEEVPEEVKLLIDQAWLKLNTSPFGSKIPPGRALEDPPPDWKQQLTRYTSEVLTRV